MGMFEKKKFAKFLSWVLEFDKKDPKTWKNFTEETTMEQVYESFGLDKNTIDFTGHAIALYRDEELVQLLPICQFRLVKKVYHCFLRLNGGGGVGVLFDICGRTFSRLRGGN